MADDPLALPGGLFGRGLRSLLEGRVVYFALFASVHAVLAATATGVSVVVGIELVLICIPQAILAVRREMSTATAIACSIGLLVAAGLGVSALPPHGVPIGYAAWQLRAITISLFGFALIGRYLTAWLTLLGVATIGVVWSICVGGSWLPGLDLVDRHFGPLLVGTLFAYGLQRSNATFTAYRALERRTRSLERAAAARAGARRSAAESVLEQAGPMLRAIADGRPLSDDDRQELLVLEGALRDQIRAP